MKIQKPLPGMTPEETERQLHYMNAVIMFKMMHSRGIINKKELRLCKEEMLKKYKPPQQRQCPSPSVTGVVFTFADGLRVSKLPGSETCHSNQNDRFLGAKP